MKTIYSHVILFVIVLTTSAELNNYKDIEKLIPAEYRDEYDKIIADESVTEHETNRKLVQLAYKFGEGENVRRTLSTNEESSKKLFDDVMMILLRLPNVKHLAQNVVASRNLTFDEQLEQAIGLQKEYPLEMEALVFLCSRLGYKQGRDIIKLSRESAKKVKQLAEYLEKLVIDIRNESVNLHDLNKLQYLSRADRKKVLTDLKKRSKIAAVVHQHLLDLLNGKIQPYVI